jgi:mRNA interferase YafQ
MEPRRYVYSGEFKDDIERAPTHRKCDYPALKEVMRRLVDRVALERSHRDHALQGRYPPRRGFTDCRECHVANDWLLVYRLPDDATIHFIRTGTHADLF